MTEPRRPVFWYQGLFLQAQHFQHADLFTQSLLAPLRRYLQPYFWGVCRLGVNETALREGTFDLAEGEFIFQDGTWVSLAGNGRVKPRSFKDLAAREDRLTVYLGLRKWRDDRPNVASLTGRDLPSDMDRRFVSGPETYESSDLYQQGPATQLKLLDYALRLFWEMEAEGAGEFHLLPIARLKLDTRQPALCTGFRPSPGDDGRFRCCPRHNPFRPGLLPFPLPPSRHIQGEGGPRRQHKRRPAHLFSCPQIPQPVNPHSFSHVGGNRPSSLALLRGFASIRR